VNRMILHTLIFFALFLAKTLGQQALDELSPSCAVKPSGANDQ